MPFPTSDTAVSRPDLGELVMEHMESAAELGFVALQVMPLFPVALQTATYPVIPKEVMLKIMKTSRASDPAERKLLEADELGQVVHHQRIEGLATVKVINWHTGHRLSSG